MPRRRPLLILTLALLPAWAQADEPGPERQAQLIRMVRQDCGSCHGIQLTGGLGPELTQARMLDIRFDSLLATIYNGRPGTPMPGWKSMISEADATWIARQLQAGFPLESGKTR
ncbi:MAG: cytochrome c [Proteobacteria bacterium]|nr:cytochrome c [Burkholderiales bacterium]MCA0309796.1 cytochrome c [Pseudomonadota bacterium]